MLVDFVVAMSKKKRRFLDVHNFRVKVQPLVTTHRIVIKISGWHEVNVVEQRLRSCAECLRKYLLSQKTRVRLRYFESDPKNYLNNISLTAQILKKSNEVSKYLKFPNKICTALNIKKALGT